MDTTKAASAFDESSFGPLVGACAVGAAGTVVLALIELGPLSGHMAAHIASMNVAAPLIAVAVIGRLKFLGSMKQTSVLWLATIGQLALLWISHSPALYHAVHASAAAAAALHLSLFLSALVFWISVIEAARSRWQAILALLVSGKLACLLSALLIFAPRLLIDAPQSEHGAHAIYESGRTALSDQHLAGLLMITACPMSYILTAIVLVAQSMSDLQRMRAPLPPSIHPHGR